MSAKSVGVVGLGIMGSAMSANLARAGFTTYGYDPVPAQRKALSRAGGVACKSVAEVTQQAPIVITSLPSAKALQDVCAQASGKAIVIETSTLPIDDKLQARVALKRKGITLLDCPLSGTGAQARNKDLSVYASGEQAAYRKCVPVFEGFARSHYFLGDFGNGSRMKFVANLLVAIHNVAAAEAFVLGMKAGLDPATILKVIGDGAGSSRMFQVRGPQMVAGKYPAQIKVDVWQKDMKIIGEFASKLGVAAPLFSATGPIYNAAVAQGFGEQDTASVCAILERMSGMQGRR
ncbi:MAG TPA: NAD(P)-dependent oxidoreductase [Burkholderiales bacterium]|jgi:3-hydroxyisobutyrate dehydrogenase-like beta-hydroxyacid dehydrogenase|nr:NAD(P)-dependent oxidoreductase [Burkholderiales bacterium]